MLEGSRLETGGLSGQCGGRQRREKSGEKQRFESTHFLREWESLPSLGLPGAQTPDTGVPSSGSNGQVCVADLALHDLHTYNQNVADEI